MLLIGKPSISIRAIEKPWRTVSRAAKVPVARRMMPCGRQKHPRCALQKIAEVGEQLDTIQWYSMFGDCP